MYPTIWGKFILDYYRAKIETYKINLIKSSYNNRMIYIFARLTLSIRYDSLFLENLCGGDHECAVNNVYVIVTLANTFYQTPDQLGTRVFFDIKEIDYVDAKLRLRSDTVYDAM